MKKDLKKPAKQSGPAYKPGETVLHAVTGMHVKVISVCKTRGCTAYMVEDKKHVFRAVEYELLSTHVRSRR